MKSEDEIKEKLKKEVKYFKVHHEFMEDFVKFDQLGFIRGLEYALEIG